MSAVDWLRDPRARVGKTPCDAVHRENGWQLLHYRRRAEGLAYATPIVMVPSLINRHYVLDLLPGKSLVEWLVARGHDVFVIDWGTPEGEDRFRDFDDIADRYIGRSLRVATKIAGCEQAPILGYCPGGTPPRSPRRSPSPSRACSGRGRARGAWTSTRSSKRAATCRGS